MAQHRTHFEDAEADHVIIVDPAIPSDSYLIPDELMDKGPTFTITIAAKIFFNRSPYWMRDQEKSDRFVLDGKPVGDRRSASDYRIFTLGDVERIIYALGEADVLTGADMRNALTVVRSIAVVHRMI